LPFGIFDHVFFSFSFLFYFCDVVVNRFADSPVGPFMREREREGPVGAAARTQSLGKHFSARLHHRRQCVPIPLQLKETAESPRLARLVYRILSISFFKLREPIQFDDEAKNW
jgi:hypothetical protein